jgi:hypothetical protein
LIGDKIAPPPQRDIYLDALRWAVHLMRTPEKAGKCTGLAALQVWAEEMTQEKYFPPGNEALFDLRYLSVTINITMLHDHRSAGPFLRQVAEQEPDLAPGLSAALACYAEVYRLRDLLDDLIKDDFSEKAILAIREADQRRAFAEIVLQIRDREAEAAARIESTLAQAGRFSS